MDLPTVIDCTRRFQDIRDSFSVPYTDTIFETLRSFEKYGASVAQRTHWEPFTPGRRCASCNTNQVELKSYFHCQLCGRVCCISCRLIHQINDREQIQICNTCDVVLKTCSLEDLSPTTEQETLDLAHKRILSKAFSASAILHNLDQKVVELASFYGVKVKNLFISETEFIIPSFSVHTTMTHESLVNNPFFVNMELFSEKDIFPQTQFVPNASESHILGAIESINQYIARFSSDIESLRKVRLLLEGDLPSLIVNNLRKKMLQHWTVGELRLKAIMRFLKDRMKRMEKEANRRFFD
ncbi:hypothetical protein PCE1_002663 [Barthelona sp. PCE]